MEFSYGMEFYGSIPPLVIRPQTERVIVCVAQVLLSDSFEMFPAFEVIFQIELNANEFYSAYQSISAKFSFKCT